MSETKNKILQAAITIWGKELTASLDDIASHAGISRRTLHRHYSGKDDLMNSVINFIIEEYLSQIKIILQDSSTNKDKLKAFFRYDIDSGSKYMVFCQLRKTNYVDKESENENLKELYDIFFSMFKELKKENKINNTTPLQWLETFYSIVVETALRSIDKGLSKEDCTNLAWTSFWNGIKN